ncbi:MAG: ATP-binding cassette domain-containing protein [Dehalococcoidia bacterium]|nr:ATP-binding cassette domain-containing protein [Dehalococcoidia bacterium]
MTVSSYPEPIVSASELVKNYGDLVAVDGIGFRVEKGECFGFLGPNGAGKTTTLRMVTCVSPVTSGDLTVTGLDVSTSSRAIKAKLGVVSQADSLDPDLSVVQNLLAFSRYFDLPGDVARRRSLQALDLFQLRDKADRKPDELSGGMRRRLLIARALLHEPEVLVLDEPTTGLDPQTRLLVWDKLTSLKSEGITMLLTTHYMEEAAYLCDRLVVIDHGRILVEGTPGDLIREQVGGEVVEVHVSLGEKSSILERLSGVGARVEDRGESLVVYGSANGALEAGSLDGLEVTSRPANLEDVFLRLTGRGLRDE